MPLCYCFTSLKESEVPKGFECELSNLVADILKKPPEVTFFSYVVPGSNHFMKRLSS